MQVKHLLVVLQLQKIRFISITPDLDISILLFHILMIGVKNLKYSLKKIKKNIKNIPYTCF